MTSKQPPPPTWLVALAGWLALAAAMGIGRFAFTPLLPLMARDGQLDLSAAGWLAAANYVGYFVGALTAARVPWRAAALAMVALLATAVSTAAMALPGMLVWLLMRFVAGLASAWVFVATSVWCLGALARSGRGELAGRVYAGVGGGIALTGLYCWGAGIAALGARELWGHLGVLALVLTLPVWVVLGRLPGGAAERIAGLPQAQGNERTTGLVVCYGLMGFGYILPATFLPALARKVVDDPRVFGLAWPLFGAMAAASTVLAGRWLRDGMRLRVWVVSQAVMGVGALLPSVWLNAGTIAISSLCVGGTFMVITLAGVQEMRARAPADAARRVGQLTAAFALGQIAGPILSALLLQWPALRAHGLQVALQLAALSLFGSALWLARRAWPA